MSEPVAIIQRSKWGMIYLVEPRGGHFDMSKHIDSSLYLGAEIERKDAAIAELVGILKECAESLGRFISQEEWAQEDMNTADSVDYFIAKYDIPNMSKDNGL